MSSNKTAIALVMAALVGSNVFNHMNWGVPGSTIGQAGAGVITQLATGTSPRQLQFALKFLF